MRSLYLFLYFISAALASCVSNKNSSHVASPTHTPTPPAIPTYTIKEQTPEQKERASLAEKIYYAALITTISDIDDGTTSAEIIARTAVSKNLKLLEDKVSAQTAHIKDSSWIGAEQVSKAISRLPTEKDIDLATYMVLKIRKQTSDPQSAEQGAAANP